MRDLVHAYVHAPPRCTTASAIEEMTGGKYRTVSNDHRIFAATDDRI